MVSQGFQNNQKEKEVASAASLDFVIPYVHSGDGGEELRKALSTLKNVGDWSGKVWIIGDYESWFEDLEGLTHLNCPPTGNKFVGIQEALLMACNHEDVSERAYYSNDDIYINRPYASIPPLHMAWGDDYGENSYGNTMTETYRWLQTHGIEQPLNYEPHAPLPVVKNDLREALKITLEHAKVRVPLQIRSVYGNLYNIGGEFFVDGKGKDGWPITSS